MYLYAESVMYILLLFHTHTGHSNFVIFEGDALLMIDAIKSKSAIELWDKCLVVDYIFISQNSSLLGFFWYSPQESVIF
jgi:hypothetical protein